jgi:hypothetical protein
MDLGNLWLGKRLRDGATKLADIERKLIGQCMIADHTGTMGFGCNTFHLLNVVEANGLELNRS